LVIVINPTPPEISGRFWQRASWIKSRKEAKLKASSKARFVRAGKTGLRYIMKVESLASRV
jgi:hypothetical protein